MLMGADARVLTVSCLCPKIHVQILETLLAGVTTALSAAKRYRLQCLQAAVLALLAPGAPPVRLPALPGADAKTGADGGAADGEEDTAMTEEEERRQVAPFCYFHVSPRRNCPVARPALPAQASAAGVEVLLICHAVGLSSKIVRCVMWKMCGAGWLVQAACKHPASRCRRRGAPDQ